MQQTVAQKCELQFHFTILVIAVDSGVTRSMVTPGPETEVIGESGSRGLGAQPPDAEKGLILHVLRIS